MVKTSLSGKVLLLVARQAVAIASLAFLVSLASVGFCPPASGDPAPAADEILDSTGVGGGLVVHLGCGDGRLTAELAADDGYLVHGLDADAEDIRAARRYLHSKGIYGRVSVETWRGSHLPYTDNLVNLIVVEETGRVPDDEIMRVLAPHGVAYVRQDGEWRKKTKLWSSEIDQWTHYLHDETGNAVAQDRRVGPPKHVQWLGKPLWCRSHEIDSSISAMVSANGRVFYIVDEGLPGLKDSRLPAQWKLVARDAFSGVVLWKRPLPEWGWRAWKRSMLEGKDWTEVRGQRIRTPIALPRRLVAVGDRVYVTLGYDSPVSVLDASTGDQIRTIEGTKGTDEILCSDGLLALCVRHGPSLDSGPRRGSPPGETIMAVAPESGRILWKRDTDGVLPLGMAASDGRVFYHDYNALHCVGLRDGEPRWKADFKARKRSLWNTAHTLAVRDDVVLFLGPQMLRAHSAETGEELWKAPGQHGPAVANPPDLFVASDLVWAGGPSRNWNTRDWTNIMPDGGPKDTLITKKGRDLYTGEVKRTVEVRNLISFGHHFRCYRSKATDRYLLWPKRGVEFLDLEGTNYARCDWVRPPCRLGLMPANGLLYMPPHQCFCYPAAKLNGFNVLASELDYDDGNAGARLQEGPAFGAIGSADSDPDDWPTFRHDAERSGSTETEVPADVEKSWQTEIGGKLTAPVAADGRLFVATTDSHSVHCLDAESGRELWRFTAGGRIDSPPTVYKGSLLFGSADGWVYCVRASDGELAWRFRAAPSDRRVVRFERVTSAWPVHGSVLIEDGVAYVAAGYSSYLDGGIHLHGLAPETGEQIYHTTVEGPHPDIPEDVGRPFDMRGARSEVLVSDGEYIYMRQVQFNKKLERQETPRITRLGDRKMGRHLFSTSSLLDDSWWDRTYWMHSGRWPGFYMGNQAPKSGQLLVFDDSTTYGVKVFYRRNVHSPMFIPGEKGYLLYSDHNSTEPALIGKDDPRNPVDWLPQSAFYLGKKKATLTSKAANFDKGMGFVRLEPPVWKTWVPVRIRAMVEAGDRLFIAGPPDAMPEDDPLAAFEGRLGARMWVLSTEDGRKLAEYELESPPAFDSLIAAGGRLFLCSGDGHVLCFEGK